MHRLLPGPTEETTIAEAYTIERRRHPDRPWVSVCMVASLDGSITVDSHSGALGNENDLAVLLTLRRLADVVIVGSTTAIHDSYQATERPGQRIGVVTNRAAFDTDTELFRSGAGFLIAPESAVVDAGVDVLRAGGDTVDLVNAFSRLDEQVPGVEFAQVEGGSKLNGAVFDADLVDELDLTISPLVVGGDGPRLLTGAPEATRGFDLGHLLVDDEGFLFTRWLRPPDVAQTT